MKTYARAATRDHHTVSRIYFFSPALFADRFNRTLCYRETAADRKNATMSHLRTADTLANHARNFLVRTSPTEPREGFPPRPFARFFIAR
jgi:hypothetical protein